MDLRHGDCLEVMKELETDSVDLLFADLPYFQTNLVWDVLIDLELFWKQVNRVCKPDAPMIFTCSVKFGNTLINSNPKNFRYDLIWIKSASTGFLNSKKMPLKKHEMIYVFYRKLPKVYTENIALHHTHKFLKEEKVIKEENVKIVKRTDEGCDSLYGKETGKVFIYDEKGKLRNSEPRYEPPLPNSIIKEDTGVYNECDHSSSKKLVRDTFIRGKKNKTTNNDVYNSDERVINGKLYHHSRKLQKGDESIYEPPLPNTILEMKSEKGKHATQKPVSLMEWILKYYSREGGVVLDATMGSGSMGVACINKNRTFIGIEKDETIYKVAMERCGK